MKITDATLTVRPVAPAGQPRPQPDGAQPSLRPGQILQASVTSAGDGQVTLEMGGSRFTAASRLGLQEGQQLLLHVTATSPQIQLQALGLNKENPQNMFFQLLSAGWDLPALLRQIQTRKDTGDNPLFNDLRQALQAFMQGLETPTAQADGARLAALLHQLGIVRLTPDDPELPLQQILRRMHEGQEDDETPSAKLLESLLTNLETARRCNHQLLAEGSLLLPLPLPFIEQGFLLIEDAEAETQGAEAARKVSLQLNLENLGELRIDMLWDDKDVLLKFTCESAAANEMLAARATELKQALHFKPLREIIFTTGNPRTENNLLEKLGAPPSGFVNTRV